MLFFDKQFERSKSMWKVVMANQRTSRKSNHYSSLQTWIESHFDGYQKEANYECFKKYFEVFIISFLMDNRKRDKNWIKAKSR